MKSEYIAYTAVVQEAFWLRRFFHPLHVRARANEVVIVYCDSMTVVTYTKDRKHRDLTKHIDIQYHNM